VNRSPGHRRVSRASGAVAATEHHASGVASRTLVTWVSWTLAAHAVILLVPLLVPGLYGPYEPSRFGSDRVAQFDVSEYFTYASKALAGARPYRDYAIEYPPLALLLFVIPRVFTAALATYKALFGVQMLVFDAVAAGLVALCVAAHDGRATASHRLVWYTCCVAALYPLLATRYDWAPMAVMFAAATLWFSGRGVAGGLAAAIGVFLKFFPAVLVVFAAAREARSLFTTRLRGTLAFALALGGGSALWLALGGGGTFEYQLARGLQIETLWAGALMVVAMASGHAPRWSFQYGAPELVAPGAHELAALALPVQGLAVLLTLWRFCRGGTRDPFRYTGAGLLAVIVAGKVLSAQYLVWLIPFAAVVGGESGRWGRWLFLFACVATTLLFPWAAGALQAFQPWAILLLNIRNALLVGLLVVWLFGPGRGPGGEARPP
jgi:hypothetical protein